MDQSDMRLVDEMLAYLKPVEFTHADSSSQVAKFYASRCVFITGATGFIGKALVDKLLRSCRDIKRIYLLIREKRGQSAEQRLNQLLQNQVFNRIKSERGGIELLREKCRAICGDITLPKYGIKDEDMAELKREVNIVFNSAASVRFVEPIDVAVRNNVYSVGQLVEFCNQLDNLQALIHISTAYSNCHKRDTIHEIFYEPPMRGDDAVQAIKMLKEAQEKLHVYPAISEEEEDSKNAAHSRDACIPQSFIGSSNNIAPDLLEQFTEIALRRANRPNTYTFTKAIAETYLLELLKKRPDRYLNNRIPMAVVRPSVVGCCWREPDVGFVDNYNGPSGPITTLSLGISQVMPGKGTCVADVVPVDMVVNMLLSTGWFLVDGDHLNNGNNNKQVKGDEGAYVFNFVSGLRNPLSWGFFMDQIYILSYKYPSKFLVRLPLVKFIQPGKLYRLCDLVNQWLPALALDWIGARLMGLKVDSRSSAVAAYQRAWLMAESLRPFISNEWRMQDSNVTGLYQLLSPIDKQIFDFDVTKIDWFSYCRNYIIGTRLYALKDEAKNVPRALKKLHRRRMLYWLSMLIIPMLFYYFFWHSQSSDQLASTARPYL